MLPYWIIFGKFCHLSVEIEHRAYWAVKQCNLAYDPADKERKLQLQELEELHLEAYENFRIYKQKVKQFHDKQILRKEFRVDQKVLLSNSHLKLIVVELKDENTNSTFQVNRHHLKEFHELPTPIVGEVESISLVELAMSLVYLGCGVGSFHRLFEYLDSKPTLSPKEASRPNKKQLGPEGSLPARPIPSQPSPASKPKSLQRHCNT
ncbi:hypothetical protein CR513_35465, partial [Mucuna pruriens]